MVDAGQEKRRGSRRRVAEIDLLHSLADAERRPCTVPSIRQCTGQTYIRREEIKEGGEVAAHVTQQILGPGFPLFAAGGMVPQSD